MMNDQLLVGVGSPHGDDQVGWVIADHVGRESMVPVNTRNTSAPLDIIHWLPGVRYLHIVDACDGQYPAGRLQRWELSNSQNPAKLRSTRFMLRGNGTHDFDVVSVLQLAQQLNQLPARVSIWGIQGQQFRTEAEMSPRVQTAVPSIVSTIVREVANARTIIGQLSADAG